MMDLNEEDCYLLGRCSDVKLKELKGGLCMEVLSYLEIGN